MKAFQLIEISAGTPYDMGKQYGEKARAQIRGGVQGYKQMFTGRLGVDWEKAKRRAMAYVPLVESTFPALVEECKGIADGAGVDFDDIMLLNCRYEILKFPNANECTSFAVLPEASDGSTTFVGQNWDYRAGIIDNVVVMRTEEPDGTRIIGLAEAGQVIRNGMNSYGIGLCANNLQSIHDSGGVGIPSTFMRRAVLSCKSFSEAVETVRKAARSVSCNYMLASSEGLAVDLETYPGGVDEISPTQGILAHANHFVVQPHIHALEVSPRGDRLDELLRAKRGSIDVAHIIACLCDHANYPQAICRHPADVKIPLEYRTITVGSAIYDLGHGVAFVAAGPPCEAEYVKYSL